MQSPSRQLSAVPEEEEGGATFTSSAIRPDTHARKHSRIHERNLSAFFPRPGQQGDGYGGTYDDPHAAPFRPGVANISSSPAASSSDPSTPAKTQPGRRGHHHRHSVSHSLFPFLDPANPASPSSSPIKTFGPSRPADNQLPASSASFRQRYGHWGLFSQVLAYALFHVPPSARALLLLSAVQIAVGATLWVQGQSGESLAVTGLGYLVVFDGIGGLSSGILETTHEGQPVWEVVGSNRDGSVRQPYGCLRLITLSHFSQAVYLLFSAVYVCKESVEHVLLLHDPQDAEGSHGKGHGSVGHGEGRSVPIETHGEGISVPKIALLAAAFLGIFLAIALKNHEGLASCSRISATPSSGRTQYTKQSPASAAQRVLNPFTAAVVLFSMALIAMSSVLPAAQFGPVDKVLALLESIAMFCIALPAAGATGQTLLQTSPPPHTSAAQAVATALSQLEQHPLVVGIASPHLWELTSSSPQVVSSDAVQAVATLKILVKPDASDPDLLELVRTAHQELAAAYARAGGPEGGGLDVSVAVERA
ncbi:hypothetical protein JCM11251_003262 [Rhodosporidiobolus azoricus]